MPKNLLRVRRAAWFVLLLAGALQGWVFRHTVSPDGVAYLDLSDAIVSGDPGQLVNAYWSPLYPALVGLVRLAVSPTPLDAPHWEFALLHIVSFFGFALSLAAFEWFLRALDDEAADWGDTARPFASSTGLAGAYLLFAVVALGMISVAGTVPDFFLSAAMMAAFACVLRVRADVTDRTSAMHLGLALAVGALAKSIGFWIGALVILGLSIASWRRGGRPAVIRAAAVFAVVTLPWVVALSIAVGHPSIGRTGALNYAWYVNDQQPPNTGAVPRLATSRDSLPVAGIAIIANGRGTDPLWFDPARWHADIEPRFSAAEQWTRMSWSVRYYVFIAAPLLLAALAIGAAASRRHVALTLRRGSLVLLPCAAALGAYGIMYTTSRHVAVFGLSMCLMLATAFPRDAESNAPRLGIAFGGVLVAIELLAPPPLRSMVTVTYGLAIFTVAWVWLVASPPVKRLGLSLAAMLVGWLLPITAVPLLPLALGALMWLGTARAAAIDATHTTRVRQVFAMAAIVALSIPSIGFGVVATRRWMTSPASNAHPEWSAAQRLIGEGVPAGAHIALLGSPGSAGWARLARYQIVAIVPDDKVDAFMKLNDADKARVMRAFSQAGATRLVVRPAP